MGKFAKPGAAPPTVPSSGGDLRDEVFAATFPAIAEYLTLTKWESGKPRKTTTLTLFVEDGAFKVCVNDRDGGRVAFVTGNALGEVWDALEGGLATASLDWRRAAGDRARK